MICFPYDDSFIFLLSLIGGEHIKNSFCYRPQFGKKQEERSIKSKNHIVK